MRKLRDLLLLVIAVVALAACENEPIDNKALTITDGESEYNIGASEQTVSISFTTTDKWEAIVEDISENTENATANWISLSQTTGSEAGEYTIKITAAKNNGKSRSALVSLICKETIKIITIKQAGQNGDNESIGNEALTITDGESEYSIDTSEQTVSVSFTTTDKWEAIVEDISENTEYATANWIRLSQTTGSEAGKYTIKITVAKNYGKSRSAIISLVCKETIKIITIKQAGQNNKAKEIRFYSNGQSYSTKMLSLKKFSKPVVAGTKSNGYNSIFLQTDSKNRVTKANNEAQKVVMEFFYDTDIVTVNSNYDDELITSVYEYKDGKITKAIDEGNNETFEYTTDGYLKEYKTQDFVMDENNRPVFFDVFYEYTWSDGCFSKLSNYSAGNIYGDFNEQHTLEFLPDVSGISNVCLSNILIDCDIWSIYRLAGKSCDRLISKMTRNGETTTYSYTFNGSGAVEKVNISNPTEGNTTIEIIY